MIHNSAAMLESTRAISMSTAQTGATSRVRASPTAEPRRPTELNKCVVVLDRDGHPDENAGDRDDPHGSRADELECLGELTKTPGATYPPGCGASCTHQEKEKKSDGFAPTPRLCEYYDWTPLIWYDFSTLRPCLGGFRVLRE